MNDAIQKKAERGGRFVAALAMLSCAMLVFAEPVEVGSPGCPHSVSLAGRWRFALGDTTNCTDSIVLPSTTDIAKKGDGRIGGKDVEKIAPERDDAAVTSSLTRHLTRRFPYVGFATYERDVEIPFAWAGRRIELFLERTKVVDAYLDGRRFGRSDTLAAPAVIELPRGTAPGRHTLRLVVDNRRGTVPITGHQTSDDTQTNWNGVMGRMEMRAYGEMSIVQVKTFPSAAEGKVVAKVVFRNDGAGEAKICVGVGVSVATGGQTVPCPAQDDASHSFDYVAPCGVSTGEFAVALGPDAPKWSEFNPVLHRLAIKAGEATATGFFTTDFWNWEMFNGPARKRKVIAPGTLGLLVKSEHPALAGFPTSFHSDYQWRELIFNGVNVVLDGDKEADVIVRGIDNITRNQNLGVIWEKRRDKGRVLYCSLDLEAAKELPEARALYRSLLDYMKHP